MWNDVTNTLCNLDFIQAKAAAKMTYELVNNFNAALEVIPDNAENIRKENERQARMNKYTRDLIACAKGEITRFELEVPESITPWTKEQTESEIERIKTNPTKTDLLKDFLSFLGNESSNLQNYACEFSHFTHQQAWNYVAEGPVGKAAGELNPAASKSLLRRIQPTRPSWNPLPQVVKRLKGHTDWVFAVTITTDGKYAISGSRDKTCIVWDLISGEAIQTLKNHTSGVLAVDITPDGKHSISGFYNNTCILWNLQNGEAIHTLNGHTSEVSTIAITPDGKLAISGSKDDTCIVWDLFRGEAIQTLKGHTSEISAIAITPDGKLAISGSSDNTCIVWDLQNGEAIQTLKGHISYVSAVAITPDGKHAISGSWDKTCIVWDILSGGAIQTLNEHTSDVSAVAITPDGKLAISAGSWDKTCIVWDVLSGKAIKTLKGHSFYVSAVAITPDGKHAISGSWDKTCIVWDIISGGAIQILNEHTLQVTTVAISPDGKHAISGSSDNTCIVWDLISRDAIQTLKGHTPFVNAVAFTTDGKHAITDSLKNCIVWDITSGEVIQTLKGHTSMVQAVAITPDGKHAISGSKDGTCIVWDLFRGAAIHTLKGHSYHVTTVAITPDGKHAISGSWDNICIVWDLISGEAIQTLKGHTSWVNAAVITPDGKHAISGSKDDTCIVWDLQRGKVLARFITNSNIEAVAIYPNGILAGCGTGEVLFLTAEKELLNPGIAITTIRLIWDFEFQKYLELSADCPLCGHRFTPPTSVLSTIEEITMKAGLSPHQSPCLELQDDAWEEPGLLSYCPNCKKELKFNPFVVEKTEIASQINSAQKKELIYYIKLNHINEKNWEQKIVDNRLDDAINPAMTENYLLSENIRELEYSKKYDEAEKAFKEENWAKAYNLYLNLVHQGKFDANDLRYKMALCRLNSLIFNNPEIISDINILIQLLQEKGANDKAQIIADKLKERLDVIKQEEIAKKRAAAPWWKKMF